MPEFNHPFVTVVIPCRNERKHIHGCIKSATNQTYPDAKFEIIVADGMSDDGTRKTLDEISESDEKIRIIDNVGRIVSTGLNQAIRQAHGEIIIRMDVHTEYAPDYVEQCVNVLEETGADNVGGPARTKAHGYMQEAIQLAYHSPFSVGGAKFHDTKYEGNVDTVTYGCWRKETLIDLRLFDEELVRNQDDELNLRIIRSGGKIWQSPEVKSWYYPRSSLSSLFKQYFQYGYWKVKVIQKHKIPASIRHLVPAVFVGTLAILGVLSPFNTYGKFGFIALISTYLVVIIIASLSCCASSITVRYLPVLPLTFAAFHIGYGCGFLRGVIDFAILHRSQRSTCLSISR